MTLYFGYAMFLQLTTLRTSSPRHSHVFPLSDIVIGCLSSLLLAFSDFFFLTLLLNLQLGVHLHNTRVVHLGGARVENSASDSFSDSLPLLDSPGLRSPGSTGLLISLLIIL
eukprot:m.357410 g.357410  ORF g.357410 m.357410 type:complete len:112 (-) comp16615_c0_seq7:131-466(-)